MQIKTGVDITGISEFERMLKIAKNKLKDRIFTISELENNPSIETLAGMYSAKEAVIKALGLTVDDWKKIEIFKDEKGKPHAKISDDFDIESSDLSISHHKDLAIAVYSCLLKS